MKLNFKNLPVGNLPYEKIDLCKQMMLKLYSDVLFLPELPLMDPRDNTLMRTIENIPGIKLENRRILLPNQTSQVFEKSLKELDAAYNSSSVEDYEKFKFDAPFLVMFEQMLKRVKPQYAVIKLVGPFSFAATISNQSTVLILSDKLYRKYIIQALALKAMWFIYNVKNISSDTKVLVLFDEPLLGNFSNLKREDGITTEVIVMLLSKLYQKIHSVGGFVGVQSFNKCNWLIPIDAGADLISFDAYTNPNNLNIIADNITDFLVNGGYVNWGIVPVMNENTIQSLNIDFVVNKFNAVLKNLSDEGVAGDLLLRHSTVSVQGNLSAVPILHAEKALILTSQLSKKLSRPSH